MTFMFALNYNYIITTNRCRQAHCTYALVCKNMLLLVELTPDTLNSTNSSVFKTCNLFSIPEDKIALH